MLSARDLWLRPAGAPDAVVRGVSFDVAPGEWLAVTGPNGCGKTTLALAAAGLAPVFRGTIRWNGRPALDRPGRGEKPVLAVLQDPSTQLLQRTVGEELRFTAANLGIAPEAIEHEVARLATRLDLGPVLDHDPAHLSAGWQQVVLVAAALVARPALLVADEPCAHLDREARERVLDLVSEEIGRGMAAFWVTQDESEIARAGKRLRLAVGDQPESPVAVEMLAQGRAIARIRIAPDAGGPGPRVRTPMAIEFELFSPGVLVLEGPNGCGKSAILGAVCGVEPTSQIEVTPMGNPGAPPLLVGQYPEQMVFRDRVADEVAYAASCRGSSREEALGRADKMLRLLSLNSSFLDRETWDLSTGEKRLVEVVAALSAPAGIIGLDEPTGGLDASRKAAIAALVRERAAFGTVLIASQDHQWVDRLGARSLRLGARAVPPSIGKKRD